MQHFTVNFKRDVKIKIMLYFEFERRIGNLKKSQKRPIGHAIEGVQCTGFTSRFGLCDLERVGERQLEKILIKCPGLFRIPAAVRIVM